MPKSFREKVYKITKSIPSGKVVTYGQIAAMAGNPSAARAVGICLSRNPDIPRTPCHRVVSSDGSLTGYSAGEGLSTKRKILESEGIFFSGQKVNLKISRWQV